MANSLMEIAEALCNHCRNGTELEGLATLYADDCVSVEAMPNPETGTAITEGLEGIRGKHAWWGDNMKQKSVTIDGPYPHGDDRFAMKLSGESIVKATGEAFHMDEICLYTVADGKIVREEFFYTM